MFLRFGYVTGQAGLWHALAIVAAAKAITVLTTLSLSAIATNTRVRGGGAYYLISRSLGVEFGGAIGVLFFLAQAISVAMYAIGFGEAVSATFPALADHQLAVVSLTNLVVFVCVYIGAGWTVKVQSLILGSLVAALASFYAGAIAGFDPARAAANLAPDFAIPGSGGGRESLFTMFALFFPAATGIMAGANMSGDLANPSRSIPKGTLLAVGLTGLVYLSQAVLLGGVAERETLIGERMVMRDIAAVPVLITVGVFAATLSSALGSMMGAPRILQALARDNIFDRIAFFGVGSGPSNEPRRAIVLTFLLSEMAILLGNLNRIAPIITMFFMVTYGLLNVATFYEAVTGNPSYRPTFRYCHWSVSLLGALGCVAVMFLINWVWALAAIATIAGLVLYIQTREVEARWGDLHSGVAFERARRSLLRLEQEQYHPKNWRPSILALSGTAWTRPHLAQYGHWLTAGHGVLSLSHVVVGDVEELASRRSGYEKTMRAFVDREQVQAFPTVLIAPSVRDGIASLLQAQGLGGLRPNTILMGWPNEGGERAAAFGALMRLTAHLGRSFVAARFLEYRDPDDDDRPLEWSAPPGPIDVWWRGRRNGTLMLLLAHLLHQNPAWRRKTIRMLRVVPSDDAARDVRAHIVDLAAQSRITIEPVVVVSDDVAAAIRRTSRAAAIVFLGLQHPSEDDQQDDRTAFYDRIEALVGDLPRVLLVDSAGGMELET